jgi:hypothetical protein
MSAAYSFRSIESIAEGGKLLADSEDGHSFVNADYRISFQSAIENPPPRKDTAALLPFEGQDGLQQMYLSAVQTPGFLTAGVLNFYQYGFFENRALPIDVFRREAIMGEPICWGIDFATWYAEQSGLETLLDRNLSRRYIDHVVRELNSHTVRGEAVVMSAPGQEIYGHWLLDIVPRLYVLGQTSYQTQKIYFHNIPDWAYYFVKAMRIDPARLRNHPARFFKVDSAIVPTGSKSGYRLGSVSLKAAWSQLLEFYETPEMAEDLLGAKIFFTRRHLAGNNRRSVANLDEIEACMVRRGYKVVAPESLSIPQQIRLMRDARVVVGEDGSALHNIIFCDPGARLGVLTLPERSNLWHLGICQILDHKIAYCGLPEKAEDDLDIAKFNRFIDSLES